MITICAERTPELLTGLSDIWEQSVRATHTFLSKADIDNIQPFVHIGLKEIETLLTITDQKRIVGFIGIENRKIEMLFLHPDYLGRGLGKQLLTTAIEKYQVYYVDVNEQNPNALAFYLSKGFKVIERSELDDQGNKFPVLRMSL